MPQGKSKAKGKKPAAAKAKKSVKGGAVTKRTGRPSSPKKSKAEADKLKRAVTKAVNEAAEEDLRAQALDEKRSSPKGRAAKAATPKKAGRPRKSGGSAGAKKKGKGRK